MKKLILSKFLGLGLISGAFAAGSYVENFESYSSLNYSGGQASLNNGAVVYANNSSIVNIFQNGSNWKALRMIQDNNPPVAGTANYVIGTVESPSTRVNSFTASFGLQFKNSNGVPADNFSFDFGNLTGSLPRTSTTGLWSSGQSGSMLSVVWDFYDNPDNPNDYVGTGGNGGIGLYKNGALVSSSTVNNPATVFSSLQNTLTTFNVRYDEELNGGTLQLNTGGSVGANNLITGGTNLFTLSNLGVNFAAGDKFSFSAWSGGSDMDVFIDNVSIKTVPEPSSASLLLLGIGGLMALRRTRRRAV